MISKNKVTSILDNIETLFPNAGCELNYRNLYELSIAVMLSAQTTDASVNKVTVKLFEKYPTVNDLYHATFDDLKDIIKSLGLYQNKTKNMQGFAKKVVEDYQGIIPTTLEELITLPGIGRKCANVILCEGLKIPAMPVDTHVERVSKRMGIAEESDSVLQVEKTLCSLIPKERWHKAHHLFIHFGRYFCTSRNPNCDNCFYKDECPFKNQK